MIRRYKNHNKSWDMFAQKIAVQLNDTHPAIAIPELMRIFIDVENLTWDIAWNLCQKVFGYTNHTLMPEALERWSVPLFEKVLPRHLQIIYEINRRFLTNEVEKHWPGDAHKKQELSIIEEGYPKMIRMAYLAVLGSHSVNGVAELHTKLLKSHLFQGFYELYPDRFNNKTNGITQRRWLQAANPGLSELITQKIGDQWVANLSELRRLEPFATDPLFQKDFMAVKLANKQHLVKRIQALCGEEVSPEALFDVQIKRIHEYKRQHLNLLHILTLYRDILHPQDDNKIHPRVFIFGGKAAPGYDLAKDIIYAINVVGERINHDVRVKNQLKVIFLPNYNVSLAAEIIPAADLSEQISLAGKEASGTGNMKLALNGACTIGTLDGANIEMLEEIGSANMFIFGNTIEQVHDIKRIGYSPWDHYNADSELKIILDWMGAGCFATTHNGDPVKTVCNSLLQGGDPFMVLADYRDYCEMQKKVDAAYKNPSQWAKMAILNVARIGKFSSDRTIQEYANDIWKLDQIVIK
jgi:glycogen phosphorylase